MINAVVKGQGLKINHPKVVADTIAYLEMSVDFRTPDWDGLDKYVHFSLGDEHYAFELVDDKITQDMHLDLPEGEWEIYIHGSVNDGETVVQRITTETVTMYVNGTGLTGGEPFPEISGSVGEQVVVKANEALRVANSVREDADNGNFTGTTIIDVVSLPTSDIDAKATYRVLYGTFVLDKMLRNDSTCHIVEWDSVPTEPGESVINDNNGDFSYVGYYNVKNNTVYGYFGTDTIEFLLDWVEIANLNILVKLALKTYLQNMTAGWRTMQEIVSSVGSHLSMSWGGVITSVESADDGNALYLYLYSKMFVNKNGAWIGLDEGVGRTGEGIGAEVFNHPDNVASGMASHAEGGSTSAEGDFSHAEGFGSKASGEHSHVEGLNTTASGNTDHAEGFYTSASGNYSHAEGSTTRAKGQTSHAEGYNTEASGVSAHAEGDTTKAIGNVSHAEGSTTTAGDIGAHAEGGATKAEAAWSHAEGYGATARGVSAHAEGQNTIAETAAHAEGLQTEATGLYSHSEGMSAKASGQSAHAEGESTKATANASHAEGYSTEASGVYAHGEGALTVASGIGSHAEGGSTKATEAWAHAEGYGATASGNSSHAEGINTVASGECSHAGGKNTIAISEAQTVVGKYNWTDATKVFIVGNGTDESKRKNAMAVDWYGNATFAGTVTSKGKTLATEDFVKACIEEAIAKLLGNG